MPSDLKSIEWVGILGINREKTMNEKERYEHLNTIIAINVAMPLKEQERELKRIKRLQIISITLTILLAVTTALLFFGHHFNIQIW